MKKNLLKGMFVAVALLTGSMNTMADEIQATLDHTASVKGGSNALTGTVDQEQEYYNNDATSGWIGWAFAQFSFSLPAGESVQKAELTWKATAGKGYPTSIYYLNAGTSIDYESLKSVQDATDYRFAENKTKIKEEGSVQGGKQYTTDVTNAIKAMNSANQAYVIFQFTGNAGSANLYGKASADAPTLVITTTSESTYAITFKETNGVAATVKIDETDVTNGTDLVDGTYNFTATATGYQDYAGSFTVAGAAQEVTFTMTAKETYNYTVKAVDGENNDLGTVATGSGFADESITYYYPEFALSGTTLYTKNRNGSNPYWGATATLDANNKEFSVTYGDGTISDVVFYKEAEDMEGFTPKTTNNATIRCSGGTGGISTEEVTLTTLESGKYKIFGQVWGTANLTATIKAGETTVWELASTGSLVSSTSEEFDLAESTTLTIVTTGANDNRMLDLVYIVRTGDSTTVGINDIKATESTNAIFNLQGQQVRQAMKGLYIVNGKKVVMK